MSVTRMNNLPGFSIDQVANAAGSDPNVLRLENLDTDIPPISKAIEATKNAIGMDEHNSYLPFIGQQALRQAIAEKVNAQAGLSYSADNVVITCGGTEGMFDVLHAVTNPGDEVIMTDPTYAGMIYRVKLVGASPKLVPFVQSDNQWRLDTDALLRAINRDTKVMFLMNPSMPTGAVLNREEWNFVARLCREYGLWLVYNAAMERMLFDGEAFIHPASLDGMADKTVIIGSASKEMRMIGWRIGWVVAPKPLITDVGRVHIYNAVTASGIAQAGVLEALNEPVESFNECLRTWQKRRDVLNEQLKGYSTIPAAGGWSQLLDVSPLGLDAAKASELLLQKGKIAVTPMTHWGKKNSSQFIRLVFSNEPEARLATVGERFKLTFG